ncbi:MAG: SDR family oxidoreductase [Bacteroidales bacterium]|nr:SDR family oxidoreductase [Bacteroidales bacterium]
MKTALIFGANGYLGKNINYFLVRHGIETICFDIHDKARGNVSNYQKLDITNAKNFENINLKVDYVYFFSGLTGTYQGFTDASKYITINEIGLSNLLNALVKQNSKARIIFPSTRLIYKGIKNTPLKETAIQEPKTIYAINKLACENMLSAYKNVFDINYTIFRICVPFGNLIEGDISYGTFGFFENTAKKGKNITIYGDGSLKRTFTHVSDLIEKMATTVSKLHSNGEIYNIGGETASLLEVAEKIASKHGVKTEFIEWPETALLIESGDTIFDGTKLDKITYSGVKVKLESIY